MLNWCVAVGLLEQSPAHGLKRHLRTRERPRSRVLTDVELRRVWAATFTSDGFPAWYGALVRLAILTGQRRGEIAALQDEWIDGAWITVPADFYKTERPHRFYLTHLACTQLPVPRRDGRRFPSDPPWSRHKLALERATRLEGWTLHDLRRTFATGLVKMGENSDVVELCIGHVQQGIRATYQHYSFEKEKRRAFERWSEHVAALVA